MNHVTSRMIEKASCDTFPFDKSKTNTAKIAKNALAKLAEDFDMFMATMNCYVDGKDETMLNKIKRIVARLAKVEKESLEVNGKTIAELCVEAHFNCYTIAEEGETK